jgi:hypothetical protein
MAGHNPYTVLDNEGDSSSIISGTDSEGSTMSEAINTNDGTIDVTANDNETQVTNTVGSRPSRNNNNSSKRRRQERARANASSAQAVKENDASNHDGHNYCHIVNSVFLQPFAGLFGVIATPFIILWVFLTGVVVPSFTVVCNRIQCVAWRLLFGALRALKLTGHVPQMTAQIDEPKKEPEPHTQAVFQASKAWRKYNVVVHTKYVISSDANRTGLIKFLHGLRNMYPPGLMLTLVKLIYLCILGTLCWGSFSVATLFFIAQVFEHSKSSC